MHDFLEIIQNSIKSGKYELFIKMYNNFVDNAVDNTFSDKNKE